MAACFLNVIRVNAAKTRGAKLFSTCPAQKPGNPVSFGPLPNPRSDFVEISKDIRTQSDFYIILH